MTYIVEQTSLSPYFISASRFDRETKKPDLSRAAEISKVFKDGTRFLLPEEVPARLHAPWKKFRDIFRSDNGILIISTALRDLLKELDPGVHQTLPIKVSSNSPTEVRFVLNVHAMQDSVIDEQSDVGSMAFQGFDREKMRFNHNHGTTGPVNIVFNTAAMRGLNCWRERRYPGSLLISNALHDEIARRRLRFFEVRKARDV